MLIILTGWSPDQTSTERRVQAFRALAVATKDYNMPLVITSPKQLLAGKRFRGWGSQVTDGQVTWYQSTFLLTPTTVVYDAMYLSDLKLYRSAYRKVRVRLKRQRIPVFNPVLPAKDELYRVLTKRTIRGGRLPLTMTRVSADRVLALTNEAEKLWVKPVFGSGGRNIAYIERQSPGKYLVIAERHRDRSVHEEMGARRLRQFVRNLMRYRPYMAQEHVDLISTSDGRKVDFRVTVQRTDSGAWTVTATTLRLGRRGSMLTNYHAGGIVRSLTNLTSDGQRKYLSDLGVPEMDVAPLRKFALRVARRLQSHYPTLGLLGLDIGQTTSGELFVYDFNGRPGRDILTDDEVVRFMGSVAGFGNYLSNLKRSN